MFISIDTEKSYDKIYYPFIIKSLSNLGLGMEVNVLNMIKVISKIKQNYNILNGERLKDFPLR